MLCHAVWWGLFDIIPLTVLGMMCFRVWSTAFIGTEKLLFNSNTLCCPVATSISVPLWNSFVSIRCQLLDFTDHSLSWASGPTSLYFLRP
jgi:hypothetical protein